MKNILDKEIIVHDYKKGPSKYESGTRLDLQITYQGEKRVTWTSSASLIEMIGGVKKDDFPFSAKIIKDENERYLFS